jgi:ABC-type transporter Mla MlaB component
MNKITEKNSNCLVIEGELSFATTPNVQKQILSLISDIPNPQIDLNSSIAKDISAVALLICLTRFAKKTHKDISFINAKENLLDLAKFSNVFDLLPFKEPI